MVQFTSCYIIYALNIFHYSTQHCVTLITKDIYVCTKKQYVGYECYYLLAWQNYKEKLSGYIETDRCINKEIKMSTESESSSENIQMFVCYEV